MAVSDKIIEIFEKVLPFIAALLILTVSLSLGEIKEIAGREAIVIAILLSAFITLYISILIIYLGGKKEKKFEKLINNIENFIKENRTYSKTSGILSESKTEEIESQAKGEVWVMTPSFSLDKGRLKKCVINNIGGKKKVKYRYLCPDDTNMKNELLWYPLQIDW